MSKKAIAERRLEVVYRDPFDLKPDPRNARTHSPEQIEQLRASIREFGFTNPVLLRPDGMIGAGHGRVEAAKAEKLNLVPTCVVEGLTDAQWRAYVLADNKLALNAGWDVDLLAAELRALEGGTADLSSIGFSESELEDLLRQTIDAAQAPEAFPEFDEAIETEHKCPKCGYAWSGKAA
jgi:ParB-like chromosome segregation protein Spo0J